jgi:hypothetical protein
MGSFQTLSKENKFLDVLLPISYSFCILCCPIGTEIKGYSPEIKEPEV